MWSGSAEDARRVFVKSPDFSPPVFAIFQRQPRRKTRPRTCQGLVRTTSIISRGRQETPSMVSCKSAPMMMVQARGMLDMRSTSAHRRHDEISTERAALNKSIRRVVVGPRLYKSKSRSTKELRPSTVPIMKPSAPYQCSRCNFDRTASSTSSTDGDRCSSMARDFCEVLGSSACPDCLRNKERLNHYRNHTSTTSADHNQVYCEVIARHHHPRPNITTRRDLTRGGQVAVIRARPHDAYRTPSSRLTYFNPQRSVATDDDDDEKKEQQQESTTEVLVNKPKVLPPEAVRDRERVAAVRETLMTSRPAMTSTRELVPSHDFFVDLDDFRRKLMMGGKREGRMKYLERLRNPPAPALKVTKVAPAHLSARDEQPGWDPVITCNRKTRYYGVRAPPVGTRASEVAES